MKSRKRWRLIDAYHETNCIVEESIKKTSQMQIDSNEAYTFDLDGHYHNIKGHNNVYNSQNNGQKSVIKSQNTCKISKKAGKCSFEMTKIKKMAKNILARKNFNSTALDNNLSSNLHTDSLSNVSTSTNYTGDVTNGDNKYKNTSIFNEDGENSCLGIKKTSCNAVESKLILPSSGQSYNPSTEDHHKQILITASQIEFEKRDKHELDPENYLKPLTAKLKESLPHLDIDSLNFKTKQRLMFILSQNDLPNKTDMINECIFNDGMESNGLIDPVIPAMPRSRRSLKRKTQADKNKKERSKMIEWDAKEKKRIKKLNRDIDQLDDIIKQCNKENEINEDKRRRRQLIKSVSLAMKRKGLVKIKHSNKRYWPQSVKDIALSDELVSCLRHIKPVPGVKTVHNQLIEKGLINLPPEIDKQYESRVKYDQFIKENASKMLDRARDFVNDVKDTRMTGLVEIENVECEKQITSLL